MPKVLHIGPCDSPGGMANVMRTLAEYPPEGWEAELLSSHVVGSLWAKWRAYRRARATLTRMLRDETQRPDIIHLHTAADWSWRRKSSFLSYAQKQDIPCVVHIHSGKFDSWLGSPLSKRSRSVQRQVNRKGTRVVVLTEDWKTRLEANLGELNWIPNPLDPKIKYSDRERDRHHLLIMGRDDPVKGHSFAIRVAKLLKNTYPQLQLTMTGVEASNHDWIHARGWVTEEEKLDLLQSASVLLLPSTYEGQPMVVIEALGSGLPVLAHEHLHSLPSEVYTAESSAEAWCSQLSKMFETPHKVDSSSSKHDIREVQHLWYKTYSSFLQE